ncbi:hypothetical protein DFQ30_004906, partial [Apophysomyces sp. BC1015]
SNLLVGFARWVSRDAFERLADFGDDHSPGSCDPVSIQLGAANQVRERRVQRFAQIERRVQARDGVAAVKAPCWIARDDDVAAARQCASDRFMGLAPHDQRRTHRRTLEVRKILGQPPW